MRVIGGHVSWTGARVRHPPWFARCGAASRRSIGFSAVPGPAAFWASVKPSRLVGEGLLVVADLELSNPHELENLAGSPGPRACSWPGSTRPKDPTSSNAYAARSHSPSGIRAESSSSWPWTTSGSSDCTTRAMRSVRPSRRGPAC